MAEERTLVKKLAEIMSEVGYIPKNGFNSFHKYKYATESDVQDACRKSMSERNLIMIPNVLDEKNREVLTAKGKTEFISTLTIEFRLEDGESGEVRKFVVVGEGQDSGDKASYKAFTGAQKYALMKLFMIPTGDDPERDRNPDTNKNENPDTHKNENPNNQSNNDFFKNKKELEDRIREVAKQTNTTFENIKKYVLDKSNEQMRKEFKDFNSSNLPSSMGYVKVLETKANNKPETKQGAILDGMTSQPTQTVDWGNR